MNTPLNQDALEAVAHERYEARRSFEGLPPWEDLLERNRKAEVRALENTVSAYLEVAQQDLERRIRAEVCRIVANASNWPTPVGAQMLGRDLAEPIDMISDAVIKIVQETFTESKQDRAIN